MEQRKNKIRQVLDDSFLIPLGMAVVVIGGSAAWLSSMHLQAAENAKKIQELSQLQAQYLAHVIKIEHDVAEIRGELRIYFKDRLRNR